MQDVPGLREQPRGHGRSPEPARRVVVTMAAELAEGRRRGVLAVSACEVPGKEQCNVGNTDPAPEHPLVGLARGGARGARLLRDAGDRRHAAWSWGKQMIAAIHTDVTPRKEREKLAEYLK